MKHIQVVGLLTLLLFVPLGQAQWIDDDDDDAHESLGPVDAPHGRAGAAEIHAVDLEETLDAVIFTVLHGDLPDPTIPVIDSVSYKLDFLHGDAAYRIHAFYSVAVGGPPNHRATLYEQDYDFIAGLDVEEVEGGFAMTVAKRLIPDQLGATPTAGSSLTDFVITSDGQSIGSICINECTSLGPQAQDRAPNEGFASYDFQLGIPQDGNIRLSSPAPVRWSNGEATTFVYEVVARNMGDEEDTVTFIASDIPETWQVAGIGPVELQAGETRSVPVPVRIPFAHEHGSDPRFLLEAFGASGTGRIELGVHYPAIPQPTGHHAQVYFHTREQPIFIFEELVYNAVGGGLGEVVYMNTAEEHDGDESVPVMGNKNGIGGDIDRAVEGEVPDYGVVYEWAIPLSPGLRVGLLTDGNTTTEGNVQLAFDAPVGDVKVFGRLAIVSEDELGDFGFNMDFEAGEQIATIPATDIHPVSSSVTVPFTVTGDDRTIPFAPDQELVLYLAAHVVRPDVPLTPNTGVYLVEGDAVLPFKEYHDPVPVNVDFPEAVQEEAKKTLDAPDATTESKGSPAVGPAALLAGFGAAAWNRRPGK